MVLVCRIHEGIESKFNSPKSYGKIFAYEMPGGEGMAKKDSKKTIMIVALVSIFICGCPGCYFLIEGLFSFYDSVNNIQEFENTWMALVDSISQGGWMVCLSGLLIIVPFILVIIALVNRSKKEGLEKLEPTGVSKEDPLPPAS